MKAIRARLAAIVASFLVAALVSWGISGTPELEAQLRIWTEHTFDLLLFLGYAVVHPWLQKRWNPTGAMTGDAARRLEQVARTAERPGRTP
ncbi:MAG TPA: hypothetical protein VHG51_08805 [Longimicrobiaceae bacterium]|nr:hypothetical protein [Longimicrobiaceae bacterium]